MALKTDDELKKELDAAVRSNGRNGKTTAQQVRTFLESLIVEITTLSKLLGAGIGRFKTTATIALTQDSETRDVTADLRFTNSPEINLLVNPGGAGLYAELTPAIRNSLPIYIDAANDSRFLFYSAGKAYAFVGAAAAVAYTKANALAGIFVFRADVTEPLELLTGCTYDMTGFDSVINSGDSPNFIANPQTASAGRISLKIRRIIRNGSATDSAVLANGSRTDLSIEGDIFVDTSTRQAGGISVTSGAKLRYRGNIEVRQNAALAFYQSGDGCVTDFAGNILTNTISPCDSITCLSGALDFTGRIDVLGQGSILQYHPGRTGNHSVRLNLSGATSKDQGLNVNSSLGTQQQPSSKLYIKGLIDMRQTISTNPNFACGIVVSTVLPIDIQCENLIILTKSLMSPFKLSPNSVPNNFPISIIGSFYSTVALAAGEFELKKITQSSESIQTTLVNSVLEFVFEAGFADSVVRTMGTRQAGTYTLQQRQNVSNVVYKVNNTEITQLPFQLKSGDTLELKITRTAAKQGAIVSLLN